MARQIQMPDPNNPFAGLPQINPNQIMAEQVGRLAVGMDMLVGLLSEHWGYELKEQKDEHGNTLLRWRPKGSEAASSEAEEPPSSEA